MLKTAWNLQLLKHDEQKIYLDIYLLRVDLRLQCENLAPKLCTSLFRAQMEIQTLSATQTVVWELQAKAELE